MAQLSKPFIIGAAIASATALAVFYYFNNRKVEEVVEENKEAKSSDGATTIPKVGKDQLVAILDAIAAQMGQVVLQLAKIEQNIRQETQKTGRAIPEDQLASYLMGQFEEAMRAVESQVYAKYGVTEDETREATEYYVDDEDVVKAANKIHELYSLITGTANVNTEVPEDLTLEKFMTVMEETMEALNVAMEDVCKEVKELNPDNKEQAINERYVKKADDLSTQIHQKYGLTREVLQAAMMKYQQEPQFLTKMAELQQIQAQRFAAAGAIFEGAVNMGA